MLSSTQALLAFEQVTLSGRAFRFRQLKLHEWVELQAWLKSVCPSPVAVATRELAKLATEGIPVPQSVQDSLFRQAQEEARRWPPRVGSRAWLLAIDDQEGGNAQFLLAALKPSGEAITQEDASDIMRDATDEEIGDMIRVTLYGEHYVPKAEAPSEKIKKKILGAATNGETSSSESENSGQPGPTATLPS